MSYVLALPALYDGVVTRMAAAGYTGEQPFGWREPAKRLAGRRIVWVPGDDDAVGEIGAPSRPGRLPARPLWTLFELCTVYIEAFDDLAAEDERSQYQAVRELLDAWLRAVYLEAHGTVVISDVRWVQDKNLRRAGAAIRVVLSVEAMVPDSAETILTAASTTTASSTAAGTDPDIVDTPEDP
jgi:hypothetical protein